MQEAVKGKAKGTVLAPFEIKDGLTADDQGNIIDLNGVAVVQIVDVTTENKDVTEDIKVSARHILCFICWWRKKFCYKTKKKQ